MLFIIGLWHRAGLFKLWGRETNRLDKSEITNFVKFARKLKVGLQWLYFYYFFIFRGSIVLYAVRCLL